MLVKIFYTIFTTKMGYAAICWNEKKEICRVFLPEKSVSSLRIKVSKELKNSIFFEVRKKTAISKSICRVIFEIEKYFSEQEYSFANINLSFTEVSKFCFKVYLELKKVRHGETISYKELACRCNNPLGSRAVGMAVKKNPIPLIIPCHRVIKSDGDLGGFSAGDGILLKKRMLDLEKKIIHNISNN